MTRHLITDFEIQWGIHCKDFSVAEGLEHAESIRMRVKRFGTPFMRRAKPTKFERKYARTLYEIAEERGVHPVTIMTNERLRGNAFHYNPDHHASRDFDLKDECAWREAIQKRRYWSQQSPWLHPNHPDYAAWRAGKLFPAEHIGGSRVTAEEIEAHMRKVNWRKYSEAQ